MASNMVSNLADKVQEVVLGGGGSKKQEQQEQQAVGGQAGELQFGRGDKNDRKGKISAQSEIIFIKEGLCCGGPLPDAK